jgi:hypothetical protein
MVRVSTMIGLIPLGAIRASSSFFQYFLICASVTFSALNVASSLGFVDSSLICCLNATSEVGASSVIASTSAGSTLLAAFLLVGSEVDGLVTLVGFELKDSVG